MSLASRGINCKPRNSACGLLQYGCVYVSDGSHRCSNNPVSAKLTCRCLARISFIRPCHSACSRSAFRSTNRHSMLGQYGRNVHAERCAAECASDRSGCVLRTRLSVRRIVCSTRWSHVRRRARVANTNHTAAPRSLHIEGAQISARADWQHTGALARVSGIRLERLHTADAAVSRRAPLCQCDLLHRPQAGQTDGAASHLSRPSQSQHGAHTSCHASVTPTPSFGAMSACRSAIRRAAVA